MIGYSNLPKGKINESNLVHIDGTEVITGPKTFQEEVACDIKGNAATSNTAETASSLLIPRKINGTDFDGSEDITTLKWGTGRTITIADADGTNSGEPITVDGSGNITIRLPRTAKMVIEGSISEATSAEKLKTPRLINGTNFDGSAEITTEKWGTQRGIKISDNSGEHESASVSVNGAEDFTLKLPETIKGKIIDVSSVHNNNNKCHYEDILSRWDSGDVSAKVQDGSFSELYTGQYWKKLVTIDDEEWELQFVIGHIDPFYCKEASGNYTMTSQHHLGVLVFGLPYHAWNDSDTTENGYLGAGIREWLWSKVLPGIKAALGEGHIISHTCILTTEIDATAYNKSGKPTGASSNTTSNISQIELISEMQLYGGTIASSSLLDTGEACQQLAIFKYIRPEVIGGEYVYALRDVANATCFCSYSRGEAKGSTPASTYTVKPLSIILVK